MSFLPLVKAWVWVSVLASVAGWTLSALGELNGVGYAVFAVVAVVCTWAWRRFGDGAAAGRESGAALRGASQRLSYAGRLRKLRARFRRWMPAAFLFLTVLVFLGGALYPPSNHAGFTYRTPRVLNWLMEGHWFWIHTPNYRMNDRACGFEWMTAPLLLFMKTDRWLFLINFASFLLMPGLVFSVLRRLGVRGRVAWWWMWLLPTGYNFLVQAASTANDTFPAVYALAAIDFALRAWETRRASDLWLSGLSAALLVGAKANNLTLLLPWAIVAVPLAPLLLRQVWRTALVVVLAAAVSFLPTAVLNQRYCGDWTGLKLEQEGMNMKSPVVGVWGNALLLMKNFVPPFFPPAGWWNRESLNVLPRVVVEPMKANFERGFQAIGEMPIEDAAGIGFGLSVLLLVSVVAAWRWRKRGQRSGELQGLNELHGLHGKEGGGMPRWVRIGALIAPWGSLLYYGMKSGIVDAPRLISAYYPLLLPSLVIGAGQAHVVRQRWWRVMVWGSLVLAVAVVAMIPGRPLWPARTILSKVLSVKPGQRLAARALDVYTVYGNRWDPLAAVRERLPQGLKVVGFMGTGDDMDISLWRPFLTRRVEHILPEDTAEQVRQRGIQYAVVSGYKLGLDHTTLAAWLARMHAELLATVTATVTVTQGPQEYYVVRFREP
jgi:hypothetical protein